MQAQLQGLTKMVNVMNEEQICDTDCQNKRKIENLRKTYIKAKQNSENSKPNLERAEKDYYMASKGGEYYSKMQEKKYKTIAINAVSGWNKNVEDILIDIDNKLKYYKGLFSYKDNVTMVYSSYNNKYTNLREKITSTTDKKNVNNRLAYFYDYNTSIVNSLVWWLKFIYWIFYAIMIVFFVLKKQYKNIQSWPFILIVGLFPVLFEYGISWNNPFKNEISKVPSIYEWVFNVFRHQKIDNIYFIFFTLIILTVLMFSFFSNLSFKYVQV
uniref:Uncharacterized protein n=1 Tax=viral metagenome TaxID=1070528 RepID=A0A6C0JD14_9ZZZZ